MKASITIAVALISAVLFYPQSLHARPLRYTNDNYGFALTVPDGYSVCQSEAPSPNHGIAVLFGKGRCDLWTPIDKIAVFAYYNVPTEARDAQALGASLCKSHESEKTGLLVSGKPLSRCRTTQQGEDTYFQLRVVGKDRVSWIVYVIDATYEESESKVAHRLFAQLVTSMRLTPYP